MKISARWFLVLVIGLVALASSGMGGCAGIDHGRHSAGGVSDAALGIDGFDLLLEASDHEALYTLAGGLKPMSTGIWRGSFEVEAPDLDSLRAVRAALAPLRTEDWYADVQVFDNVFEGRRSAHAFVVHRESFAHMIDRHGAFWGAWGITRCTHPSEVIAVVDRMPRADRWRGYGYMFGYPADAVDFFVEAGLAASDGREVGPGKDRQFVQIPTFAQEAGRFTYAVPLDHIQTAADRELARRAEVILGAYSERRHRITDVRRAVRELRRLNGIFEQEWSETSTGVSR